MSASRITAIKEWYETHERRISTGAILFGFIFDSLTLQRIDALRENLWIAGNLILVGVCIVLLNSRERGPRAHFWLTTILQFGFGALLGAFFIFYFRSATLAAAWPFMFLLLGAMAANELFQKRYARLAFQVSLLYISIFFFAIYIVPLAVHSIGAWVFLLSGLVSLGILWLFIKILQRFAGERLERSRTVLLRAIAGIFIAVNFLYFTNLIPPIPLSLKDAGIYHSVSRGVGGSYAVEREDKGFFDYFRLRERVHWNPGQSLYAYSAVFSPAALNTNIVHEWQYKNPSTGRWTTSSRIPLSVSGGRGEGFRTYSAKSSLSPGLWRVNVATPRGQLIGRVTFRIVEAEASPELERLIKE